MKAFKSTMTILALVTLACFSASAFAKGNPSAGQSKAAVCEACHGKDGKTSLDPSYPILAGQYSSYLAKALQDYRSGKRTNAIMAPMASGLSDQDIEDLAAWYSSQEGLYDLSIKQAATRN